MNCAQKQQKGVLGMSETWEVAVNDQVENQSRT